MKCAWAVLAMTIFMMSAGSNAAPLLSQLGSFEVMEEDYVFATPEGIELQAHSYRPKNQQQPLPAAIDIHGGAWSTGDRTGGALYDRALASAGLYVMAIDFRQAPKHRHPAANQDIVAAIRYLHANATRLRLDTGKLGLIGSSSGGHLALLTGLMPNAPKFAAARLAGEKIPPLDYVIALWPVSDPAYRYEYAKSSNRDDLIKSHDAYFGSVEQMSDASVPRAVRSGEAEHLPRVLLVQPGNDANIPREMTLSLIEAYQSAGGYLEYLFFPGQPHAFGHRASPATDDLVRGMRDFIERRLHGGGTPQTR